MRVWGKISLTIKMSLKSENKAALFCFNFNLVPNLYKYLCKKWIKWNHERVDI